MKKVATVISELSVETAISLASGCSITVKIDNEELIIESSDVIVQRTPRDGMVVASAGNVMVVIETMLTPELVREGLAREFVSKVQNLRKDMGLEVSQRIMIDFVADDELSLAIKEHYSYIVNETLAIVCQTISSILDGQILDINGHNCKICIVPKL
jgi:isoleucyl-tRNA synthetase